MFFSTIWLSEKKLEKWNHMQCLRKRANKFVNCGEKEEKNEQTAANFVNDLMVNKKMDETKGDSTKDLTIDIWIWWHLYRAEQDAYLSVGEWRRHFILY